MPVYHLSAADAEELRAEHMRAVEESRRLAAKEHRRDEKERTLKGTVFQAVEVNASAFSFGFLRGWGHGVLFNYVPVDLTTGVFLHVAGFLGDKGRRSWAPHLHNLADGALASFFTTLGASVAPAPATTTHSGASTMLLPPGNPNPTKGPLSERELVSLIQSTVARAPAPAR